MPTLPAIRYFSTNKDIFGSPGLEERILDGSLESVGLAEAIMTGQAPDGGLYMPSHLPVISKETIARMRNMTYPEVFVEVMAPFFAGVLPRSTLERIANEAYTFAPYIERISDKDIIGRLDEGPTASFKDFALVVQFRIMSALLKEAPVNGGSHGEKSSYLLGIIQDWHVREENCMKLLKDVPLHVIVLSSSGDTESSAAVGCLNVSGYSIAVIHSAYVPQHVRDLQAKQMDTLGCNTDVIRVPTDFDGCAAHSSRLLKDPELKYMHLNTANSVNIVRILAQVAYYFYLYSQAADEVGEEVRFSVPSGNFGDATAGMFAMSMGLPIKLIVGVNENDVVYRLHRTGMYAPALKTHASPSNSMNVNWPSNVRRIICYYGGQLVEGSDPDEPSRRIITRFSVPDLRRLRQDMAVYRVSDKETDKLIWEFYLAHHMIDGNIPSTIEPHGAVAWGAAKKFRQETGYRKTIMSLETAHPGKFPESLQAKGIEPVLPKCLADLVDKPHGHFYAVRNNYEEVKRTMIEIYAKQLARQRAA